MQITRKAAPFQPIILTMRTQKEVHAFRDVVNSARINNEGKPGDHAEEVTECSRRIMKYLDEADGAVQNYDAEVILAN